MTEMKNKIQGINNKVAYAEEHIPNFEDKVMESTQAK